MSTPLNNSQKYNTSQMLNRLQKSIIIYYGFNMDKLKDINGRNTNGTIQIYQEENNPYSRLNGSIIVGYYADTPNPETYKIIYLKRDGWFSDKDNYNYDLAKYYKNNKLIFTNERERPAQILNKTDKKGYTFKLLKGFAIYDKPYWIISHPEYAKLQSEFTSNNLGAYVISPNRLKGGNKILKKTPAKKPSKIPTKKPSKIPAKKPKTSLKK